jgi:hypothetical protein
MQYDRVVARVVDMWMYRIDVMLWQCVKDTHEQMRCCRQYETTSCFVFSTIGFLLIRCSRRAVPEDYSCCQHPWPPRAIQATKSTHAHTHPGHVDNVLQSGGSTGHFWFSTRDCGGGRVHWHLPIPAPVRAKFL